MDLERKDRINNHQQDNQVSQQIDNCCNDIEHKSSSTPGEDLELPALPVHKLLPPLWQLQNQHWYPSKVLSIQPGEGAPS
jgi:hypothetical protein